MQRDSIDFGSMKVGQLFCKQLFPTLLGMVFSALFVITDGVFVGRGIGVVFDFKSRGGLSPERFPAFQIVIEEFILVIRVYSVTVTSRKADNFG